jgi:phenylacetate-CoA ligase
MSTCTLDDAPAAIQHIRPRTLVGLPSQLHSFALTLPGGGGHLGVRLVITSRETLASTTRRLLERTFSCRVLSQYASWEFAGMATECVDGHGYHATTPDLLFEFLRLDGTPADEDEEGLIVVTDLRPRAMPLIRYAIGDVAVAGSPGRCPCGHPFAGFRSLRGRQDDRLRLADGRSVSPFLAVDPLYRQEDILQFRVIQEDERRFRIEYVADHTLAAERLDAIRRYYQRTLGAVDTDIVRVAEIPTDPSGKIRKVISYLSAE